MIGTHNRFHGQSGLHFVYKRGKTIRTRHCAVKYVVNTRTSDWRVAVVISKKSAKSAPLRNRIRRRIYEQVRVMAPRYLRNHDVVFTVFDAELALAPTSEVEQLVSRLLKNIQSDTK